MKEFQKSIIGWREWVAFPLFDIQSIKAKIDTGAKTSAIHAEDIQFFHKNGKQMVKFKLYPFQRNRKFFVKTHSEVLDIRSIRSSNGKIDLRPIIKTDIMLMGKRWEIELSLTNRDLMGFRLLLGRQALSKRFIVDVSKSYMAKTNKKKAL